jgi:hypothetical protein
MAIQCEGNMKTEEKGMAVKVSTVYFERRGPDNTKDTLKVARERAGALNITDIVVASYTGSTGASACEMFKGFNVVVVGGVYGFEKPNSIAMLPQNRTIIEGHGGHILFTGHAFGMMGRAVKNKFGAIQVDEIVANVLRLLSQGVKVGCEITCMAVDAGLIRSGSECIAIAGSATGADTAIVLRATNTHTFFDMRILEVICKPRG